MAQTEFDRQAEVTRLLLEGISSTHVSPAPASSFPHPPSSACPHIPTRLVHNEAVSEPGSRKQAGKSGTLLEPVGQKGGI